MNNCKRKQLKCDEISQKSSRSENKRSLQGGKVQQCVEGSRHDRRKLVVIERKQTDVLKASEAAVVDATDEIVPEHPDKRF